MSDEPNESINENHLNALLFFVFNSKELIDEVKKFQSEQKKYKSGLYLWLKEEYPLIVQFFDLLSNSNVFSEMLVFTGIKDVINEYYKFTEEVRKKNESLFEEEFNYSKTNEFIKTINPIEILSKKEPFIKYIKNQLKSYIDQVSPDLKEYIKKSFPIATENIKEYTNFLKKDITPSLTKSFGLIIKAMKNEITFEECEHLIAEETEKVESAKSKYNESHKELNDIIQKEITKFEEKIKDPLNRMENLNAIIKEVYNNDSVLTYEYLRLTKDIDSFNIKFSRFLNRLFHILTQNNRDFIKTSNCYYNIAPEPYNRWTRNNLKKFLAMKLKNKYQKLSKYLLKCYKYNIFRRIESHEIPDITKLSKDKKIAYIPQAGNKQDIEMKIVEIKKHINTYCFFIDSLGIYES